MHYPDDDNGEVLQRMAAKGIDLTSARMIDFEHLFVDKNSAQNFVGSIANTFSEVIVYPPEPYDESRWGVRCRKRMTPSHQGITETETGLANLAQQFGGYADGWGFMSNPDGAPTDR